MKTEYLNTHITCPENNRKEAFMKNCGDKIQNKYNYLLDQYEETKDFTFAIQIVEMLLNKELTVKVVRSNEELMFSPKSGYRNKCTRCSLYYEKGDPCFYGTSEKLKLHEHCASKLEKDNCSYYQKWLKDQEK